MKLSKKLGVSIGIVMIGGMLLFPIRVIAKEKECFGPHNYETTSTEYSVTTTTHPYLCGTIALEDGTEEYVYQDCTVTTTIDRFQQKCKACDKLLAQQGSGEKSVHSHYSK